jgi:TctA family transporter
LELLDNLAIGFDTALTLQNLFYAFAGCLIAFGVPACLTLAAR